MSITISSGTQVGTATPLPKAIPHRTRQPADLRPKLRPSTERESFALIGALKRSISGDTARDTRLSRGERYAALTHNACSRLSPRLAEDFALRLESNLRNTRGKDFGNRLLRATDMTVRGLVAEGILSPASAQQIRSTALGDTADKSNPVRHSSGGRALGRLAPSDPHPSSAPSNKGPSTPLDAPRGFLWKPISDSDGLLAVLLPIEWSGETTKVEIISPNGETVLATGRPAGVGNGGRAHFRFDRPGVDFPTGSIVRVHRADGSVHDIVVSQTSIRGEGATKNPSQQRGAAA